MSPKETFLEKDVATESINCGYNESLVCDG